MPFFRKLAWPSLGVLLCFVGACDTLELDPKETETHVVFDPTAGKIPLPNDLLRDEGLGHLSFPIATDASPAEADFRRFMNEADAWPTTTPIAAEFSQEIDPKTLTPENIRLYQWISGKPVAVADLALHIEADNRKVTIDPPIAGWPRGERYVMLLRGGPSGVHDTLGRPVGPDKTFHFLRARVPLDKVINNRAFPGETREARMEIARKLETTRLKLVPFFEGIEAANPALVREQISALWSFTITSGAELAMDRVSQRVPLPFDLLVNAKTQKVELTPSDADTALEKEAKAQLSELPGFGVSMNFVFELTVAVDPATATPENVKVYKLGEATPREIAVAEVRVLPHTGAMSCVASGAPADCVHVLVKPADKELPLAPGASYAVVVRRGLRARGGGAVRPMPIGHFLRSPYPLFENGESRVSALTAENAEKLERVRAKVDPLLTQIGRDDVVSAWSFTTLDAAPGLKATFERPETIGLSPTPSIQKHFAINFLPSSEIAPFDTLLPDPLIGDIVSLVYGPRIRGVKDVYEGTIDSPYFLDRITKKDREDGSYEVDKVRFTLTLPEKPKGGGKIPVVIFGHGLVTDRRFVLTIAGALAKRGFAAVAIDFPFHGERAVCIERSLVAIPNFFPAALRKLSPALKDDLLQMAPCPGGSSCVQGKCLTPTGEDKGLARFPVMDLPVAGGAALLDVEDIPHINERFKQALVDLGSLRRSLKSGAWSTQLDGAVLDTDRLYYTGQSLGGIIGAIFVSLHPDVDRAVLNVPGSDMVDLFVDSTMFGPQMEAYFKREQLEEGSYKKERLLNVARWLVDSVDPHSVGHLMAGRSVGMQMDKGDFIIPNHATETLQRVSGLRMKTYPSSLHADLVVPLVGDGMLDDLASYLSDPATTF